MPNKAIAKEWLKKAYHNLSSAQILYDADHYTDTIGFELQQAIEKILKSFLAYENKQIKKTHNLIEVYELVTDSIQLDESKIRMLGIATNYYVHDRYPVGPVVLPERKEINEVLEFAENLFEKACRVLEIDQQEIKNP